MLQKIFPATLRRRRMHRITFKTPPMADLQLKLARIDCRQQQLKIAFNQLNSQIRTGLIEVEDVFASLATALSKLVGLKTGEMADEGRFSSIIINNNNNNYHPNHKELQKNRSNCEEAPGRLALGIIGADENHKISRLEEEDLAAKATKACKELMQKQKMQLMQLMQLLKQIEAQVNSSQDDIFQTLADHRASIQKLFQKAVTCVYAIHQSCQNNGISINMVKLLKVTFDRVGSALGSVEIGVENLMAKLGDKMCNPMVEYVNELKAEIITGTYPSLLATVEGMGGEMRLQRLDLEEAGKKVRAAEKSRLDALSKLKKSEERIKMLKEEQSSLLEANKRSMRHSVPEKSEKLLRVEEDQAKDEKLLWELLRTKRKLQVPDSPFGAKDLLGTGTTQRNLRSTRVTPPIRCKPTKMRQLEEPSPQAPNIDFWIPLGSSSSTITHQVLSCKRITP